MKQNVLLFVLVAVLGAGAGAFYAWHLQTNAQPESVESALLGQPRPPFTLGASDGRLVSADEFNGKVMLVNFWATWCAPCRKEMPMLEELHQDFVNDGLAIVGIALDDVQRARDFADELGIGYTILVGGGDVMATGLAWGNQKGLLPYTVLVDRDGIVRWAKLGEITRKEIQEQIRPLL